jgi:hypothetical protein
VLSAPDDRAPPALHGRFDLHGIQALSSTGSALYAVARGAVWSLGDSVPRRTGLAHGVPSCLARLLNALPCKRRTAWAQTADLVQFDGDLAVLENDGRLVTFDAELRVRTEYERAPFSSSLLEWEDVAVEVRRAGGLLVMQHRFDAPIDIAQM